VNMKLTIVLIFVIAGAGLLFLLQKSPVPPPGAGSASDVQNAEAMLRIDGGEFSMGDASGRADETPHTVRVDAFFIDRNLVTQEIYESVVGINPSKRKAKNNPVEQIRWNDAVRFCNKASECDGLTPCYDLKTWVCNVEADGYRLPSEAEWEFACRAGSKVKYCFGDDESQLAQFAWCKPHSLGVTHPVGSKKPNAFGLFDMHGNVWQWCNDFYADSYYKQSPRENPRGPADGTKKVLRGGAWDSPAEQCRAAYRRSETPMFADACFGADSYGFRRVRSATAKHSATPGVLRTPDSPEAGKPVAEKSPESAKPAPAVGKIDVSRLRGTIVFVSDRGGALDIWKMDASGKNAKQLTKDAFPDADPKFSHDGKRILYTTLRQGFPEVWMMNRDGSDPHMITKGSQGAWSPDGGSIVFIRDNQTYVRELAAKNERRVTSEAWDRCGVPAWEPDGKHIAVASRHLESIGIFRVSLDGKDVAQIKTGEASCTPRFSKDGARLLCQTVKGHIHQLDADGKNWEQITVGGGIQHEATYSPDEKVIAYCRAHAEEGPWQIYVQTLDDDESSTPLTHEGSNLQPDWSPESD
jgi:formylglycine-generating enzyme required for sulfatase activity/Tol biopolymer transport system component